MKVNMIQNFGNRMKKIWETFNKDIQEIKSTLTVINNTITEIKNTLERINSRITEEEEWISELEDRKMEINATEQNKNKEWK